MKKKKQHSEDKTEDSVTYAVPGEVAIALSTGRSQFIDGLVDKVRKGRVIEPVQVVGMLELIRDWTDAKYADDRRNTIVQETLEASRTNMLELQVQIRELLSRLGETVTAANRVARRHGSGPLGPGDDAE